MRKIKKKNLEIHSVLKSTFIIVIMSNISFTINRLEKLKQT